MIWAGTLIVAATAAIAAPGLHRSASSASRQAQSTCTPSLLFTFDDTHRGRHVRDVPIWRSPDGSSFFFEAGMTIDADGAPNAYSPANTGLDDLANAGEPGNWEGLATGPGDEPIVQGPNDPFPGFYVSCTSLTDRDKPDDDPTKYVDASAVPYVVLPREIVKESGVHLGDFAVVFNLRNGKSSYAIFADVGTLGEGSIALAQRLRIDSDARAGGTNGGILYLVFPGSGNRRPRQVAEIESETEKLFEQWGGNKQINACAVNSAANE